jgi:cytoskeletal protein CcmA (bactofilin family)
VSAENRDTNPSPHHLKEHTMTTIGASLVITGEVTSREDMTIHGRIKGQISMDDGALLIAPTANVEADVHVKRMTIHGNLAGDVAAAERVELTPTAKVTGTLIAPAIVLADGATFNGTIEVERRPKTAMRPQQVA